MSRSEFPARVRAVAKPCSAPNCARQGRGNADNDVLCGMHYQRWVKYGSTELPNRRLSADGICTVEGCDNAVRSGNGAYCDTHYYRLRRGSPKGLAAIATNCVRCGSPLKRNQSRFCSKLCMHRRKNGTADHKACAICGDVFATDGTNSPHCSPQCRTEAQRQIGHRRRAMARGAQAEKFGKAEIFKRDGWCCQLCGKKTNRRVGPRHPMAPSLDHIVPISKGGAHTRTNVQCAHLQCNVRKQARIHGQMRLFG